MKTIDFTKTGGMPLTQNLLARMQEGCTELNAAIVQLVGGNAVISGVESTDADTWTDGWIVYDGKVLPFLGGGGDYLHVIKEYDNLMFNNGLTQPVLVTEYLSTFGGTDTGIQMYNTQPDGKWGPFPRINLGELFDKINTIENEVVSIERSGSLPQGGNFQFTAIRHGRLVEIRGQFMMTSGFSSSFSDNISSLFIHGNNQVLLPSNTRHVKFWAQAMNAPEGQNYPPASYCMTFNPATGNLSAQVQYSTTPALVSYYYFQTTFIY
jgi:hypothetical protein